MWLAANITTTPFEPHLNSIRDGIRDAESAGLARCIDAGQGEPEVFARAEEALAELQRARRGA